MKFSNLKILAICLCIIFGETFVWSNKKWSYYSIIKCFFSIIIKFESSKTEMFFSIIQLYNHQVWITLKGIWIDQWMHYYQYSLNNNESFSKIICLNNLSIFTNMSSTSRNCYLSDWWFPECILIQVQAQNQMQQQQMSQ